MYSTQGILHGQNSRITLLAVHGLVFQQQNSKSRESYPNQVPAEAPISKSEERPTQEGPNKAPAPAVDTTNTVAKHQKAPQPYGQHIQDPDWRTTGPNCRLVAVPETTTTAVQ
ncbi:hypothetical protein Nepgr_033563 [Nepenthes gracilis]|uniref:Uncharacterized protein n=1 Tax=Nepenthes gracilis TaxID=150966 RepID=A0AAD3TM29_NEPGR|nr:hypothetical protein Nepgr_033563 [Nepenthes gracilis]